MPKGFSANDQKPRCTCLEDLIEASLEEGQGRNEVGLHIALHLYHANLPIPLAQDSLLKWNNKQKVPLERRELQVILQQAFSGKYGLDCHTSALVSQFCKCQCPNCTGTATIPAKKRTRKKEEGERIQERTCIYKDGILYEQLCMGPKAQYVYMDADGDIQFVDRVEFEGIMYRPVSWDNMEFFCRFPNDVESYGNPDTLLSDITQHIYRYVEMDDRNIQLCALYAIMTWFSDRIKAAPYLVFIGDYGTGKSRAVDVVGDLCRSSIFVAASMSPASLYRTMSQFRGGTLCLDEIDPNRKDEQQQILWSIIRAGLEARRGILRISEKKLSQVEAFTAYGPKLFSLRADIMDAALKSRTYSIRTRVRRRRDIPRVLLDDYEYEAQSLRNRLLRFRLEHYERIDPRIANIIELGDLEPRLEQTASALAVVFHNIPEIMAVLLEYFQEMNQRYLQARMESVAGLVAHAILQALKTNLDLWGDRSFMASDVLEEVRKTIPDMKVQKVRNQMVLLGLEIPAQKTRRHGAKLAKWYLVTDEQEADLRQRYDPYGETKGEGGE